MNEKFSRTARLIGEDGVEILQRAHVLLFGLGGVGGYVCEALVRAGVGELTLVDNDTVALSNFNRQILAVEDTLGLYKTEAAERRIRTIHPYCIVHQVREFYLPPDKRPAGECCTDFDFSRYDYVVDAIDTVSAKIDILCRSIEAGTPVISAMGTGNKTDAAGFVVTDIAKTNTCPLAQVMRRELRRRGVNHCKVCYSPVPPEKPLPDPDETGRKQSPASISFVPPVCGLLIAGEVVRDLLAAGNAQTGENYD